MRVDEWSYYSVDRPPVKFRRIRRTFDAPTDNYSGIIAGLMSDVFGLRIQSPGLSLFSSLSSRPFIQSTTHRQALPNLSRQLSCHRWTQNIPKYLQNVSVLLIGLCSIFFSTARLRSDGLNPLSLSYIWTNPTQIRPNPIF